METIDNKSWLKYPVLETSYSPGKIESYHFAELIVKPKVAEDFMVCDWIDINRNFYFLIEKAKGQVWLQRDTPNQQIRIFSSNVDYFEMGQNPISRINGVMMLRTMLAMNWMEKGKVYRELIRYHDGNVVLFDKLSLRPRAKVINAEDFKAQYDIITVNRESRLRNFFEEIKLPKRHRLTGDLI